MASSGIRHAILPAAGDGETDGRAPSVAGRGSNPDVRPSSQETPGQRGMRRSKRDAALRRRFCPLLLASDANSSRAVWELPIPALSTGGARAFDFWRLVSLMQVRSIRGIEPNNERRFFLNRA